jgi:dGTPase
MQWQKLLSAERYAQGPPAEFHEDARRILYSTPFRRLQGKTQVHPLPRFDYIRTRLTHTIEVAHIGRMIATKCAKELNIRGENHIDPIDIGDIVYAACLAHDVGNPPFGHIGEYAIQTWFKDRFKKAINDPMTHPVFTALARDGDRKNDFLCFDGNAQGFRILTRLSGWRTSGGLQLTYATLGAFSKYPWASNLLSTEDEEKKKFGFMYEDRAAARKTFSSLGLILDEKEKYCRHPLAFIVEAADDICYLTTDIEDAHRLGDLEFPAAALLLEPIAGAGRQILPNPSEHDRIAYLRSSAVLSLADAAVDCFCNNIDPILEGLSTESLIARSGYKEDAIKITNECEKTIYVSESKMQVEAAGYNMIIVLMDLFGGMIEEFLEKNGAVSNMNKRNDGLYRLLPKESREGLRRGDPYASFLVLVDYISGMTDRYLLDTYQRLTGSSVSLGRML